MQITAFSQSFCKYQKHNKSHFFHFDSIRKNWAKEIRDGNKFSLLLLDYFLSNFLKVRKRAFYPTGQAYPWNGNCYSVTTVGITCNSPRKFIFVFQTCLNFTPRVVIINRLQGTSRRNLIGWNPRDYPKLHILINCHACSNLFFFQFNCLQNRYIRSINKEWVSKCYLFFKSYPSWNRQNFLHAAVLHAG